MSLNHVHPSSLVNEIQDHAIISLDANGFIQNFNRGTKYINGYRPEEVAGKYFSIFYTIADRLDGKPNRLIQAAQKEGKACDRGWIVRKDGSNFWGIICIAAVHDNKGNIAYFGKITKILTEEVQLFNRRNLSTRPG